MSRCAAAGSVPKHFAGIYTLCLYVAVFTLAVAWHIPPRLHSTPGIMHRLTCCCLPIQAVVNTGAAYPAGSQSFTMVNPNYQTAISASGWTVQGASNGVVSGVVQLVILPPLQA